MSHYFLNVEEDMSSSYMEVCDWCGLRRECLKAQYYPDCRHKKAWLYLNCQLAKKCGLKKKKMITTQRQAEQLTKQKATYKRWQKF